MDPFDSLRGHHSLQTASEDKSDLRFEISDLNNLCSHGCLDSTPSVTHNSNEENHGPLTRSAIAPLVISWYLDRTMVSASGKQASQPYYIHPSLLLSRPTTSDCARALCGCGGGRGARTSSGRGRCGSRLSRATTFTSGCFLHSIFLL